MKKPSILLTGASGFVGTRFQQLMDPTMEITSFHGNICDQNDVVTYIKENNAEVVVHLASKTHIDHCETDRENGKKGDVWKTNVTGTGHVAKACKKHNKFLIFLSTECVFDGKKGNYQETDAANPINWYGETKWQAEQVMRRSGVRGCILRAVLAYGHVMAFPYDLVGQMIAALKKGDTVQAVIDQEINPTFIDDLVSTIAKIAEKRPEGMYHYGGAQTVSPYAIGKQLTVAMGLPLSQVQPIRLAEYFGPRARLRLKESTLNCTAIERDLSIRPSDMEQALPVALQRTGTDWYMVK